MEIVSYDSEEIKHAELVGYTKPTEKFAQKGIDNAMELIAFCARVSNPSNQFNTETSARLIDYLIKHKHWSPLEMANATLELTTTRDIARQILRHRSFSFQEFSQRYANPVKDLRFHLSEARLQDTKNRQNSVEIDDPELQAMWEARQMDTIRTAVSQYNWAIERGIAKEVARKVLPEGLTESRMYMNGTLRSWVHFCELRTGNGTQKECMEVAKAIAEAITAIFPMVEDLVIRASYND